MIQGTLGPEPSAQRRAPRTAAHQAPVAPSRSRRGLVSCQHPRVADLRGPPPPLPPFNRSQPGANGHEVFADEFALALLMPPHLLGRPSQDPRDAQEQASRLKVSPRALRRWRECLGQNPWDQRRIDEIVPIVDGAVRAARD